MKMIKKLLNFFSNKDKALEEIHLTIAIDFSDSPGVRYISEGPFSGELFRDAYLYPKLNEAMWDNKILVVNFDGGFGYGTAFLEEAFGGLVRVQGESAEEIKKHLKIVSIEEPGLVDEIMNYLDKAKHV